jgi:hypothetical protein
LNRENAKDAATRLAAVCVKREKGKMEKGKRDVLGIFKEVHNITGLLQNADDTSPLPPGEG